MRNKFSILQSARCLLDLINTKISSPIQTSDIGDGQITYPKIQDVSTESKLLGRGQGAGTGDVQEITLGTNLSISGITLNASGGGSTPTGTGFRHVTGGAEDAAAKLVDTADVNDDQITYAKIQNITTARVLGRTTGGSGDIEELSAGVGISISGGQVASSITQYTDELAQDAIGDILLDTATIDLVYDDATPSISANVIDNSITYAKIQDVSAASRLLGRGSAAGAGNPEELTLGTNLSLAGTVLNASGGAGASWTTVEANLGNPSWRGKFTITDAAISPTSKVIIQQAPGPYTGKGTLADEAEMDPIFCFAAPGSGQAIVHWQTLPMLSPILYKNEGRANIVVLGAAIANSNNVVGIRRIGKVKGNVKFNYTVA